MITVNSYSLSGAPKSRMIAGIMPGSYEIYYFCKPINQDIAYSFNQIENHET